MTVTRRPRTLTTPMTSLGARGTSVTGGSFRISRTSPIGTRVRVAAEAKGEVLDARPASLQRPGGAPDSVSSAREQASHTSPSPTGAVALARRLFDERGGVEHERHALIAELGGAGETPHPAERLAERLDDDVLLPDELVDDEPEAALRQRDDDHELPPRVTLGRWRLSAEEPSRRHSGSVAPRSVITSRPSTVAHHRLVEDDRLLDARERHRERAARHLARISALMIASVIGSVIVIFVPMPTSLVTSMTPPSLRDVRLHDVHADAAAGELVDVVLRREPGQEDEVRAPPSRVSSRASASVTSPRRAAVGDELLGRRCPGRRPRPR